MVDNDNSNCTLTFEEPDQWLRATWQGYVDPLEAMHGADNYLAHAASFHCPYLLNDNLALRGPWFDSVEWLEKAWLPRALDLGLRFIAHVVQSDTRNDILTVTFPQPIKGLVELQIFHRIAEAEEWLRNCQQLVAN